MGSSLNCSSDLWFNYIVANRYNKIFKENRALFKIVSSLIKNFNFAYQFLERCNIQKNY